MTKLMAFLITALLLVTVMAGCQTNDETPPNTENSSLGSTSDAAEENSLDESTPAQVDNMSDSSLEITETLATQAFEKWKELGESTNFRSIEEADTKILVGTYSSYLFYHDMIDLNQSEIWISKDSFDSFVKDYFGVDGENYRENYPAGIDEEKGYTYNYQLVTSVRKEDMKSSELTDYGVTETGEYYFTYKLVLEMEKELFPEGENVFERVTTVTFKKSEDDIHFLTASYVQDGEAI